jgi:hypothetical protein
MTRSKPDVAQRGFNCEVVLDGVSPGAMTRPAIIPEVHRKRGNPNWGRFVPPTPVVATEFELQVRHLRLTRETYVFSSELRRWCWQNRNRVYIPEWLLGEWHITVNPNVSDAAKTSAFWSFARFRGIQLKSDAVPACLR